MEAYQIQAAMKVGTKIENRSRRSSKQPTCTPHFSEPHPFLVTEDGFDETLIPIDFQKSGQISDDELFKVLICPMSEGGACL